MKIICVAGATGLPEPLAFSSSSLDNNAALVMAPTNIRDDDAADNGNM